MITRSTWVLLAIFVILLAVVLLLPQFKGNEAEPSPTITPVLESPFTFLVGDVVEFRVVSSDGATVIVGRGDDSIWKLIEPKEEVSESNNIEGVVAGIVNINLLTKIDPAPPADVSGIASPMYTVTMVDKNGKEEGLLIGNLTPTSSGYYVQTDDGQVFVAETSKIDQVIELVQNPPIDITPTPLIQESEVPLVTPTEEFQKSITPQATLAITPTVEMTPENLTSTTPTP